MTKIWAIIFLSWGCLFKAAADPGAPLRLAILPTEPSPETKSLADLLPLELQETGVEIVERAELDRVLKEQSLTAAGLAGGVAGRVAVGKLLRADGFLFVGRTSAGERLSARLVETRHGYQVCQMLFRTNDLNLASLPAAIAGTIKVKLPILRRSDESRILIAVLRIGNTSLDPSLSWVKEEAPFLFSACLSAHPDVLTLERRELGILHEETLLTDGGESELRKADLLVDGDVFLGSGQTLEGREYDLTMVLRARDRQLKELGRFERKGKAAEVEAMIAGLASDLLDKLGSLRPRRDNSESAEMGLLRDVANKEGFWALQAAYALDTGNDVIRRQLIKAILTRAYSAYHRHEMYRFLMEQDRKSSAADRPLLSQEEELNLCVRLLSQAADLALSTTDPAEVNEILRWNFGSNIVGPFDRKYRGNPEITEPLRPVRAWGRAVLEREYSNQLKFAAAIPALYYFFENDTEEAAYMACLVDRIRSDPLLTPSERQKRLVLMETVLPLPGAAVETLCRDEDVAVRFFANIQLGRNSDMASERKAHYEEAGRLVDAMFDDRVLLNRLASSGVGRDPFYEAVNGLCEYGGTPFRDVKQALTRRISGWVESRDLTTLGDLLAYRYFALLDAETAMDLHRRTLDARKEKGVLLPQNWYGQEMMQRMEKDWNNKNEFPMEPFTGPYDQIVLLSSRSKCWEELERKAGKINGCDRITLRRLRIEGDQVWILFWDTMGRRGRLALMQMDLTSGKILSYRTRWDERFANYSEWISPLFAWNDYICVSVNNVGIFMFPRQCEVDDHTFDKVRRIDMRDGLPSVNIRGSTVLGDVLYVGLPTALLALPGGKGLPRVIATMGVETASGPMAGAGQICGLAADEKSGRLFILTDGSLQSNNHAKVWRYTPNDGSFTCLKAELENNFSAHIGNNFPGKLVFWDVLSMLGHLAVEGYLQLEDESMTNDRPLGIPPTPGVLRYDIAPYRGGLIAGFGGFVNVSPAQNHWKLVFIKDTPTADVANLAWAVDGVPRQVDKDREIQAKVDSLYAVCSDAQSSARLRSMEELAAIDDGWAIKAQIRLLQNPDRIVRRDMVQVIVRRMQSDFNKVREAYNVGNTPYLKGKTIPVDVFEALLTDDDPYTACMASSILVIINNPKSVEPLLNAINYWARLCRRQVDVGTKGSEKPIRVMGTILMFAYKDRRVLDSLKDAIESGNVLARREAATVLGQSGDPYVVDLLLTALDDEDSEIRKTAIDTLGHFEDPRIVQSLDKMAQSTNGQIRVEAERALKKRNLSK